MVQEKIRSSLTHLKTPQTHTLHGRITHLHVLAPSFPLSWPNSCQATVIVVFLHVLYFLISSCHPPSLPPPHPLLSVLWIKCIVIFISTSLPLETIIQPSFDLQLTGAQYSLSFPLSFPFLKLSYYSVLQIHLLKLEHDDDDDDAGSKTFHHGRPIAQLAYYLAGSLQHRPPVWLCACRLVGNA